MVTDMEKQRTREGDRHETKPAQAGPPPTMEQVFRDYAPRIYTLALRMLGNEADAEDVTQDVLLQLIRKLDTFRGESAFPTWLHRVTVNAALAYRRKRASREQHHVHDTLDSFLEEGKHAAPVRNWCPPCVVILNTYRLTIQLARQLPSNPLPPPCEERLRTAVSEQWKQQWSSTA